jgi:hypothetical protein
MKVLKYETIARIPLIKTKSSKIPLVKTKVPKYHSYLVFSCQNSIAIYFQTFSASQWKKELSVYWKCQNCPLSEHRSGPSSSWPHRRHRRTPLQLRCSHCASFPASPHSPARSATPSSSCNFLCGASVVHQHTIVCCACHQNRSGQLRVVCCHS